MALSYNVVAGPRAATCRTADLAEVVVVVVVIPTIVVSTKLKSGSDIQMSIVVRVNTINFR